MNLNTVYNRHENVAFRKVADEYILVPLSDDIADMDSLYTMNEVGAFIWEHIDGKNSVQQIIQAIVDEFEVQEQEARKDALAFFQDIQVFLK